MLTKTVVIKNPTGLHLRPAGNLCKEAVKYKSKITFNYRNNNTNAKSVLSVLAACVKQGESIELVVEGDDEEQYESILDIWPDFPTNDDDYMYNEEEY